DYGIRCVIAPSFADIFYNNCFKNGILPIILPEDVVNGLQAQLESQPGAVIAVDLPKQELRAPDGTVHKFTVDAFRKECLLKGLDDIGLTLQHEAKITAFEAKRKTSEPWLALA
ncbi:MAG: 3-isopropylmalate dehydratase small subunit, partial [Holosporales bacterium]